LSKVKRICCVGRKFFERERKREYIFPPKTMQNPQIERKKICQKSKNKNMDIVVECKGVAEQDQCSGINTRKKREAL
jgi:hypothetical protein